MQGYGQSEDSPMNDLWGVIGGSVAVYAADTLIKRYPNKIWPQVTEGLAGIAALWGRHYTARPTVTSMLETTGHALTAGAIGNYVASNYKTLGKIPAGNIPTQRIGTAGSALRRRGGAAQLPPGRPLIQSWNPWNEYGLPS